MQNPLTFCAGGVFLHANPAEKHCVQQSMLGQQNQETCAGKTISTDKHKSPSDIIRSFQKKSQFRTIAPKMVPKILTSGVISCLQSSLPERNAPISAAGSKPLVVPTQNYAVMQVAGHEGTFSLLALPYVAPALTQQVQQSNVAPSENLKLPIPRYQPLRNKPLSDKKPAQVSVLGAYNKNPTKASIPSQASPVTTLTEDYPKTHSSSDITEQVMQTGCDSAEMTVATLVNRRNCVEPGSPLVNKSEIANGNVSGPSVVKDSLSKPASTINPMKLSLCSVKTASEATRESFIKSEKLKEKPTNSANSVTVLSPAVFGSTIQMTSSAPKGKLPILPYSRMRNSVLCKSKQNTNVTDVSGPSLKSECEKVPALAKTLHVPTKTSDKRLAIPRQTIRENTFSPSNKVDVDSLKKLNGAASKRRARKRRAPDDLLAFQTKRRKCIINKFREGRERVKVDLQPPEDKKAEAVKKYRSIRPKPVVVVQAFAPLTAATVVETPSPDHLHTDREVHRVVISTEPSPSDQQPQMASKKRDTSVKGAEEATERGNKCNFEDLFHNPGEVKLQIKCSRCQFIVHSFGEMKFHLLCSHGEEIQGRVKEGVLHGNRGAKGELIKHTTHFWKQRNERRHLAKSSAHEEEVYASPKLKRQMYFHQQNNVDMLSKSELTQSGSGEAAKEVQNVGFDTPSKKIEVWSKVGYNCILCKQLFGRKEDLCNHWQSHHNCEDPSTLWTIFSLLSKQGIIELSDNGEY
ncbi:zinc finger protein 438 [Patagioenas fasciata monilis]|uniref:Zinc finger protein 438 n=1 Tax=Patagioenas fasciata monilis TaxID=372326 RepID=A0A1V4KLQ6_PATFA|nr:zinc finger protein 438 [Patagioenas fasciata monilis]